MRWAASTGMLKHAKHLDSVFALISSLADSENMPDEFVAASDDSASDILRRFAGDAGGGMEAEDIISRGDVG